MEIRTYPIPILEPEAFKREFPGEHVSAADIHIRDPPEQNQSPDARQWRALKSNVRRFWTAHGQNFWTWWLQLSRPKKKKVLNVYPKTMSKVIPEDWSDALKSSGDAVRVCPELNMSDLLSEEKSLLSLYEKWAPSELADDSKEAQDLARRLLDSGSFERRNPDEMVMLADVLGLRAGNVVGCLEKDLVFSIGASESTGYMVQRDVLELSDDRLRHLFSALALVADEYRKEVLNQGDIFVASPLSGCAQCKAVHNTEGMELEGCKCCVEKTRL